MSTRMWTTGVAMTVCALAAALSLIAAAAEVDSEHADSQAAGAMAGARSRPSPAEMAGMRAEAVQRGLDEAAARIEIRASQEPAWNDFSKALKALTAQPDQMARPNQSADAAALLHRAADEAATRSQALARLADAATKLQTALDPNQRQVFDQIVRMRLREYAMRDMRQGPMMLMRSRGMMRMPDASRMPGGPAVFARPGAEGTPQP